MGTVYIRSGRELKVFGFATQHGVKYSAGFIGINGKKIPMMYGGFTNPYFAKRDTEAEAQADLDRFAEEMGLPVAPNKPKNARERHMERVGEEKK